MCASRSEASERLLRLAVDAAVGIGLALMILLIVLLAGQAAPAFVYEMF